MKVSVIIPTLGERDSIAELIQELRRAAGALATELVVVDADEDETARGLARRAGADLVLRADRPGRALQMHQGAQASTGEVLLFLHADTRLPDGWRRELEAAWSKENPPSATAFRLGFDDQGLAYRLLAAAANARNALTGVPQGDQAIAVARGAYFEAGGFPPEPLMEEYLLIARLKKRGPVRILPEAVATSTRRYERAGKVICALRNSALVALFYLGVPPRRLSRFYR